MVKQKHTNTGQKVLTNSKKVLSYIILSLIGLLMIGPFLWMISTSLKETGDIFTLPPKIIPDPVTLKNYSEIFEKIPFIDFTLNSLKIAILATIGQVFSCSLAAYAFARMKFRGKNFIYYILLGTMMIPSQVTMIPIFIIMKYLGWIDSHMALIAPAFFGGAFGTFLLRQFFMAIPKDIEDAARIDGCGRFSLFWKIFLPQTKPALATLAVFSFMFYWNDLFGPVIYLSTLNKMTLTVGLASIQGLNFLRFDLMMAGGFLTVIPILILFIFAQKFFINSIILSGMKE
jgi:multiple sugar transport system permease protein